MHRHHTLAISTALLLAVFALSLTGIQAESLWLDEAWTANALYDDRPPPADIGDVVRGVRDSLLDTLATVRVDVHPPLYFILLDLWTLVMDESEFALRLPSALVGLGAIAGTIALGRQWFDARTGLIAGLLLGTLGFYVYYTREARMYTLYLAWVVLATWAYTLWWRTPTRWHGALYSALMTFALYTHYVSATVIVAHVSHHLLTRRRWQMIAPYALALVLYMPWLPIIWEQWQAHPLGASTDRLSLGRSTWAALWLLVTSGYWGGFALAIVLSRAPFTLRDRPQARAALGLCALWVSVPIISLALLQASGLNILQMRYLIVIVPSLALTMAYMLATVRVPVVGRPALNVALMAALLVWVVYTQVSMIDDLWAAKPPWRATAEAIADQRDPLAPALVNLQAQNPATYYNRQIGYADGIALNIGWRTFAPSEIRTLTQSLSGADSVWVIAPAPDPSTWDALAHLRADGRGITWRASVNQMLFYQLTRTSDDDPRWTFGTGGDLRYDGTIGQTWRVPPTEALCLTPALRLSDATSTAYRVTLRLTRGYHEQIATTSGTPGDELCLRLPPTMPDTLHLRLSVTTGAQPLPVYEQDTAWGDFIVLGTVNATD